MIRLKTLAVSIIIGLLLLFVSACTSAATPAPSFTPLSTSTANLPTPTPTDTPIPPSPTTTPLPPTPTSTPTPQVSLSGRIVDNETGELIASANVSVGDQRATTNTKGEYALTGLPLGQYVLSVTYEGYDPGLSPIITLTAGEPQTVDLSLFPAGTSPYPADPMLTNPVDPSGAPTPEEAERLARLQGLTGEVVEIKETKLTNEWLVNYKIGSDIRAAVADLSHEVWKLTDEFDQVWYIIKLCGNLASRIPPEVILPTPEPRPQPLLAEVVDELTLYTCALEECATAATVPLGAQVEVGGCLADGGWCQVSWDGIAGWCTGDALRQLVVAEAVPVVEAVLPTATPALAVITTENGKIIFNSVLNGERTYYIMNVDGSNLTPYTEIHGGYGDWLLDGARIAFSHEQDIYVMNSDGSGLMNLTNHPAYDSDPIWSPDGRQILFKSNRDDPDPETCLERITFPRCNFEIYVMNTDGSGLTNLTNNPESDEDHAWLPNGRIIFSRGGYIYMMNADGSNVQQLTEGNSPLLSPDGSRFVFFSSNPFNLSFMNINSLNITSLTTQSGLYQTSQRVWSPDSQKIAFGASLTESDGLVQIYSINADGSNLTRLTNISEVNGQPAWSPDGQKIAFVSHRDGNDEIYIMNADGSTQTRLTNRPDFIDIFPRWSR